MACHVEWVRNGAYGIFSELVNFGELMQLVQSVHIHPNFDQFQFVLLDFMKVVRFDTSFMNPTDFLAHMIGANVTNPKLKTAILATEANILALATALQVTEKAAVQIFTNLEDAQKWANATK